MALPNIMEMFRRGTPVGPQPGIGAPFVPGAPQQQQQITTAQHVANNSTVPTGQANEVVGNNAPAAFGTGAKGDESPLANYADLWKVDPKNPGGIANPVPVFNLDPAKLNEAAAQIDFTQNISAELIDKAAKGDATALGEVIKQAGRAGFTQSAVTTGTIVKDALEKLSKNYDEHVIPEILRRHTASTALRADENPIFTNPATAPMLKMLEKQIMDKNPTASPQEITAHAKEYLLGFVREAAPGMGMVVTAKPAPQPGARKEEDWGSWA